MQLPLQTETQPAPDRVLHNITINPIPTVTQPADLFFCDNVSTSIISFSSSTNGITYGWVNNNTAIGLAGSGTGNIPAFTATNKTDALQTASITVTPYYIAGGATCAGFAKTFTITVNPTPAVIQPQSITVCNGNPTTLISLTGTVRGSSFNWTNNNSSIGLTTKGIGDISSFNAVNSTIAPITASITVTPAYSNGSVSCSGSTKTFSIIVNPTPVLIQPNNLIQCNGDKSSIIGFSSSITGTTYSWSNDNTLIGLETNGTGSIPSFNTTNNSSVPIIANITVTPNYSSNGASCTVVSKKFTITINPTPTITQPVDLVFCNGTNTSPVNFTNEVNGTTYTWTNSNTAIGLASSGNGNLPAFKAINNSNIPITVTIAATPVFVNGVTICTGIAKTFSIIINPTPILIQPDSLFVCNGNTNSIINFTSSVTGTTYTWTNNNPAIGLGANGIGSIPAFTAINTGTTPVQAIISVTTNYLNGGITCTGIVKTFVITVNPVPTISQPVDVVICKGSGLSIKAFESNVTGTSFSWVNNNPSIGLSANGKGNITFTSTNSTSSAIVANVTVTPAYTMGGVTCNGSPSTFSITVNPSATVDFSSPDQTTCPGNQTTAVNLSSTTTPVKFTWTSSPPAGISGAIFNGADTIPIQTLINTTNSPITVNYIAKATTSGSTSCIGYSSTYSIVVNPIPILNQPSSLIFCNQTSASIINFISSPTNATFSWINDNDSIGLGGSGTGNIPTFTAINKTNAPIVSNITVTASYLNKGVSCLSSKKTFTITVNPTPIVTQPTSIVVCNGNPINLISFNGSLAAGTTYSWVNNNTSIGMAASGVGDISTFIASNNSSSPVVATITVSPQASNEGVSCTGLSKKFEITVNPSAKVQFSAPNQTICSGSSTTITNLSSASTDVNFSWTCDPPNGITGIIKNGTTSIPAQTLINTTNGPITVQYIATASTTGGAICPGFDATYSITINPIPTIAVTPDTQVICSNTLTKIALSSSVNGTIFKWTVSSNLNISGASNATGNTIEQQLVNNSNTVQKVTYTITPSYTNNDTTCTGDPISVTVSINPLPTITNSLSAQTICSADTSSMVTLISNVAGSTFEWSATAPSGVTGFSTKGTSIIPAEKIVNTSSIVLTITYTIITTANGCTGLPKIFTINVNPKPSVTNSVLSQVICSGLSTTVVKLTSNVDAPKFTWTATGTNGLSGYLSSGAGDITAQYIQNSTSSLGTVTYTIIPYINGCPGKPVDYIVSVNPSPTVKFSLPAQTICSGTSSSIINIISTTTGINIKWTSTPPTGISGAILFGTNSIPAQTLVNTTAAPIVVSYTAAGSTTGSTVCGGEPSVYTITVNPSPVVTFSSPPQTICSGTTTDAINLSSTSPTVKISWACIPPAGIMGITTSGTNIIPIQTLTNTTNEPVTINYIATASTNDSANCQGAPSIYSITVNPKADAIATPGAQTICSNTATDITLSSSVIGTTFSWSFVTSGSVAGAANGNGNSIKQVLINSSTNTQTVNYSIIPIYKSTGALCNGTPLNLVVTVNPKASISNNPLSQTICTDSSTIPVVFTSLSTGTTYNWTTTGSGTITGYISSGIGNLPAMPLINTGTAQASLVYAVTTIFDLCAGAPTNFTVLVNPGAIAQFQPTDTIKCPPFIIDSKVVGLKTFPLNNSIYQWYINGNFVGNGTVFPGHTIISEHDSVTISLKTLSINGCKTDSMSQKFYTYKLPHPSFDLIDTVGCGPLLVQFKNTTSDIGLFTYHWNFGNGKTSSLPQPGSIVFLPAPKYNDTVYHVSLQIFSICDTIIVTHDVRVKAKPKAIFTPTRTVGCSPMSISFINTSLGLNNTYHWDFGDGTTLVNNSISPVQHIYHTGVPDTFFVKLVAINECGSDSIQYAIYISPNNIKLNFAVNGPQHFGCAPHTVAFINNTIGASSFYWNFGDGNILTTSANIDTVYHTYLTSGNFTIKLTASNSCTDTTTIDFINVFAKPIAAFITDIYTPCKGNPVNFSNHSTGGTSYLWQFGDGATSALVNPTHIYNTPGIYTVTLTVFSANAPGNVCTDVIKKQINVVSTLPGIFTMSAASSPCAPLTVTFVNQNRPSVTSNWNFGDGTFATGDSVVHTYNAAAIYKVKLTVTVPGSCTYITTKEITINGPAGNLLYSNEFKCNSNSVRLEVTGSNFNTLFWNFGDGKTLTTTNLIVFHKYTNPGKYLPKVSLLNTTGCNILLQGLDTIKVDNIDAGFTTSIQNYCGLTTVLLKDTSHVYYGISTIAWTFGDGKTATGAVIRHDYFISGNYQAQMIITSNSGCSDTVTRVLNIHVNNLPVANINAANTKCTGNDVLFTGLIQSTDPITLTQWTISNGVNSNKQNLNYTFTLPGNYKVQLIAGTSNSCFDTTYHTIQINQSPTVITSSNITICLGSTSQLMASGATSYQWSPLEWLNCITCANPIATPKITTPFFVTGTNNFGCSVTASTIVTVIQPFKIASTLNDTICIGESVNLLVTGATRYLWSPVLGLDNTNISNPIASPGITTSYRVVGYDGFNCFTDTAFVLVTVGKYPTVNLGADLTLSTGTLFPLITTIQNGPIKTWLWTPSTNLSCNNCATPVATIKKNIIYTVNVENIYGCIASDTLQIKVFCENTQVFVPNTFTPDGDGINDVLMLRGTGVVSVKFFRIFNRWGEVVFEKANFPPNNINYGWDGKVRGIAGAPDVYVYTAEVVCENGTTFTYKGNISIIK